VPFYTVKSMLSCPPAEVLAAWGSNMVVSARVEQAITTYIDACNDADAQGIAACFLPDAVHYFPGAPKWSGAAAIGGNFSKRVRQPGQSGAPECLSGHGSTARSDFFAG
jgi:hypothetical protein